MTSKRRRLLDRVLSGEDLARILDDMAITSRTWNRWMQDEGFRSSLAETVEQKEITEVIDALTLNRRAYNKLLRATNGGGPPGRSGAGGEEGEGREGIDEKQARIILSIIDAMAKRLGDLAPRLIPQARKGKARNPLLGEKDYAAISDFLRRRREAAGDEAGGAGAGEPG